MSLHALKTIRVHNWKWKRRQCVSFVQKYINILNGAYPDGLEGKNMEYYIIPGYEHVTKNQPILVFNSLEKEWKLSTTNLFLEPSNNN